MTHWLTRIEPPHPRRVHRMESTAGLTYAGRTAGRWEPIQKVHGDYKVHFVLNSSSLLLFICASSFLQITPVSMSGALDQEGGGVPEFMLEQWQALWGMFQRYTQRFAAIRSSRYLILPQAQ